MGYSIYGTGGHLGIPSRSCASCASATGAAASAGAAKARGAQLLGVPGVAMDGGFHGHGGTPKWFTMENPDEMDDLLGYPYDSGNHHIK